MSSPCTACSSTTCRGSRTVRERGAARPARPSRPAPPGLAAPRTFGLIHPLLCGLQHPGIARPDPHSGCSPHGQAPGPCLLLLCPVVSPSPCRGVPGPPVGREVPPPRLSAAPTFRSLVCLHLLIPLPPLPGLPIPSKSPGISTHPLLVPLQFLGPHRGLSLSSPYTLIAAPFPDPLNTPCFCYS